MHVLSKKYSPTPRDLLMKLIIKPICQFLANNFVHHLKSHFFNSKDMNYFHVYIDVIDINLFLKLEKYKSSMFSSLILSKERAVDCRK